MKSFPPILIIESALLLLAISYIALLLGRLHRSNDRWKQGYDAGKRVGWYDASDELVDAPLDYVQGLDYRRGWNAAAMHLETYWDDLDKGNDHGTRTLGNNSQPPPPRTPRPASPEDPSRVSDP